MKHKGCDEGKAKQNWLESAEETAVTYTLSLFASLHYAQLFICANVAQWACFSLFLSFLPLAKALQVSWTSTLD